MWMLSDVLKQWQSSSLLCGECGVPGREEEEGSRQVHTHNNQREPRFNLMARQDKRRLSVSANEMFSFVCFPSDKTPSNVVFSPAN